MMDDIVHDYLFYYAIRQHKNTLYKRKNLH